MLLLVAIEIGRCRVTLLFSLSEKTVDLACQQIIPFRQQTTLLGVILTASFLSRSPLCGLRVRTSGCFGATVPCLDLALPFRLSLLPLQRNDFVTFIENASRQQVSPSSETSSMKPSGRRPSKLSIRRNGGRSSDGVVCKMLESGVGFCIESFHPLYSPTTWVNGWFNRYHLLYLAPQIGLKCNHWVDNPTSDCMTLPTFICNLSCNLS